MTANGDSEKTRVWGFISEMTLRELKILYNFAVIIYPHNKYTSDRIKVQPIYFPEQIRIFPIH